MFESSCDILLIAIAAAVVAIAVFYCIGAYYVIMILKRGRECTEGWSDRFKKVDEILDLIKEKLTGSNSYLTLVGEGVKHLIDFVKEKKKDKGEEKK